MLSIIETPSIPADVPETVEAEPKRCARLNEEAVVKLSSTKVSFHFVYPAPSIDMNI